MGNLFSKLSSTVGWKSIGAVLLVMTIIRVRQRLKACRQKEKQKKASTELDSDPDAPPPLRLNFLYFGDLKSLAFAPIQLILLTLLIGKMLNPGKKFPFPWFSSEFFTYIKETFFQYELDMSLGQKYKSFVEAVINAQPEKVDPTILATFGKITMAYNFFSGRIHQITLPLYFWYALIVKGDDLCDIKADGVEEEGLLSYVSLLYHCVESILVMSFGSLALMKSQDLTAAAAQIMIATTLTDFKEIKKFAAAKNIGFLSALLEDFNPSQRTLELKQTADKRKYDAFESCFTYANLAFCAMLSKIIK